ncbi:MAG: hypothetical protein COC09_09220 [Gammaproteobacteria bacterium]|nr:hypothetical protein [Gammaproteobacteria bacterium]PCH62261.1 MAG: hypothetical protein COC09_09220 [Gammaproteobacteria bacterium]
MITLKSLSKLAVVAITAGALYGCASHEGLEASVAQAQADAASAAADASAALSAANSAKSAAASASSAASAAQKDADAAYNLASDASECCDANTDRLDRMFKKSMQK